MMIKSYAGGCCLFFLAAMFPGDSSAQVSSSSEAQTHQPPVLQSSQSTPVIGSYMLKDSAGKPCIKADMGAEYIVLGKKKTTKYPQLKPSKVTTGGSCSKDAAVLNLMQPDDGASLQFTFKKEKNRFYVTKLTAQVSPLPDNKTYSGSVANVKLFGAACGQSFRCRSESLLTMSSQLKIKLVSLKMQAFNVTHGQYGAEVECWADYNRRVVPVLIGATVVTLGLIAVLTYLFNKDRRRQGYGRI